MVEITFDAVAAHAVPKDLYLSMRIGETQKFAKAHQSKIFKFPGASVNERRWAKLEIYKRVGVCSLDVEPAKLQGTHEVMVQVDDNRIADNMMKYHVNVSPSTGTKRSVYEEERLDSHGEAMNDKVLSAHDYLDKYQLEQRISDAMRAVLRDRPEEDPGVLVANMLLSGAGKLTKIDDGKPRIGNTQGEELKAKARNALSNALYAESANEKELEDVKNKARKAFEKAVGAEEEPDDARVEQLRQRAQSMFVKAHSQGRLQNALENNAGGSGYEPHDEERLKSKAREAMVTSLLGEDDGHHDQGSMKCAAPGPHDEEDLRSKARDALTTSLLGEGAQGAESESDDEHEIILKAREAMDCALLLMDKAGDDDTEELTILAKARQALDSALLSGDIESDDEEVLEKARDALDSALLGEGDESDAEDLILKARHTLESALLPDGEAEHEEEEEEEVVKDRARDALEKALLDEGENSDDEQLLMEKARNALDDALMPGHWH